MDFLTSAAEKCETVFFFFLLLANLIRPNSKGFQLHGVEKPSGSNIASQCDTFCIFPAASVAPCCLKSSFRSWVLYQRARHCPEICQ